MIEVKNNFVICKCGDAINLNFVKKFYIRHDNFGVKKDFYVNAYLTDDRSAIIDIFDNIDDAKNCVKKIVAGEY